MFIMKERKALSLQGLIPSVSFEFPTPSYKKHKIESFLCKYSVIIL